MIVAVLAVAVRSADDRALVLTGGIGGLSSDGGDIPGPEFVRTLIDLGAVAPNAIHELIA